MMVKNNNEENNDEVIFLVCLLLVKVLEQEFQKIEFDMIVKVYCCL